jgi:hypothetical protein
MAIFEYPKTRYVEWQRFLSQAQYYPYYTIGNPPMPIEDRKRREAALDELVAEAQASGDYDLEPTRSTIMETWRRKAEEVVAKMRDEGVRDPERCIVIPKWEEVSGEPAVVVDYTRLEVDSSYLKPLGVNIVGTEITAGVEERPEPVTDMDKKVDEMASDVLSGKATATHRGVLRKAIDQKEAPLTGRAKADAGLGRAIRFGGV